jgi:tetratricopeptide (TPR) repeat protein
MRGAALFQNVRPSDNVRDSMDANVRHLMTQLRQNPLDFSVLDALRQHCEASRSYAVWAEALEHHARAATAADGDPIELGRLHYELGNLYRHQLGRADRALVHYRTAIDFDASARPALSAARAITSEAGNWAEAADLLAREADSLPPGGKRAAALVELAQLYKTRLRSRDQAESALREAVASAPSDLQVQHELATSLLESADALGNGPAAEAKRREAADVLASMARAVTDDYAFAYVEAALDAVADHEDSLRLVEQVAPRMGRSDVLAPRWLAGIRSTRDAALARTLRLKMATAYIAVGQLKDARICLEPLVIEGDAEALALARRAKAPSERPSKPVPAPSRPAQGSEQQPEELLSSEMLLESQEAELESALEGLEQKRGGSLADELADFGEHLDETATSGGARNPLADLAKLDRGDARSASVGASEAERPSTPAARAPSTPHAPAQPASAHDSDDALAIGEHAIGEHAVDRDSLEAIAASLRDDELDDELTDDRLELDARSGAPDDDADDHVDDDAAHVSNETDVYDDDLSSREELLDSGELSMSFTNATQLVAPEPGQPTPFESEHEPPPSRPQSQPPRLPSRPSVAPSEAAPASEQSEPRAEPPREDDDVDPFSEETQPRATPLTLAELTALTGEPDRGVIFAPASDVVERDPDREVTQLTPAEDPQVTELRTLRAELAKRLRFRDRRGAAEVAETLLERGVFDAEAIEALEDHYRLARDFKRLRDLSLQLARELSFPGEARAGRLREAVMLSETKLGDQDGAIEALRELLTLAPDDVEAHDKLAKLLRRAQRWDELSALLGQRVEQLSEGSARAELLREIGNIAREKQDDPDAAIAAYARARELDPGQLDDELVLSDLYLAAERFDAAAELLELRLARLPEHEAEQRPRLLETLAELYDQRLHDDARARHALEQWRALEPRKLEPLLSLIRVLERVGEHRALVDALTDQLELAAPSERVGIHVRVAELALSALGDPSRAADSYGEAIALSPQTSSLWRAATPAFMQAGRAHELDELLWGIAQGSRDRALSAALFGYLAETRAASGDLPGSIAAREAEYAITQEAPALESLVGLLRVTERTSDLARRLDELAKRSTPEVARGLRLERADVLANKLDDPEAAKAELERALSELGADDAGVLRKLIALCLATGDTKRRASAQESLIKRAPSLSARVELATELVDIYEHELSDAEGAIRVLTLWTSLEPENPSPYMRLLPLLAQRGKKRELVDALDKLAKLAISDEESGEFLLRAARVAIELEDYDGAWNRLVPRMVDLNDAAAERMLRELTRVAGRGEQLAALYVGLAQRSDDPELERRRWADAARVFEQEVAAYDRALEAMLRALAKQLDNRELLAEVERLTERADAWPRLAQVYDAIVRKADNTETRVELLMRHGRLLETRASQPAAAFERVWLAFQLDPANDETYGEARRLAELTGRRDELLGTHERRAQSSASREARVAALLEACAFAQHELEDTARATGYLSRAVSLAGDATALLDGIEARVRDLDQARPPIAGRGLMGELAGVYAQLAQEGNKPAPHAPLWLSRAARIHELSLDDPDAAFRNLERASALAPGDEQLLDELNRVAALGGNWEALAKHLQQAADSAIDSNSSSASLSRLGALYERELASPSRAADAYEQLVRLRPKDAEASRRLRQCLRASERFDELLIAIDRELFMLKPEEGKRELLKQAAETWEFGLKNRYEAVDAWKKVSALAPADPDAVAALARLRVRPRADDSLLDDEIVVLPEDLRPSLVAPAPSSLFGEEAESDTPPSATFLADQLPAAQEADAPGWQGPDHVEEDEHDLVGEETSARVQTADWLGDGDAPANTGLESPGAGAEPGLDTAAHEHESREEVSGEHAVHADFDADVTLPLDRGDEEDEGAEPSVISLEGLSSLLEPQSGPSSSAPPAPPPLQPHLTRTSSRTPPPPPPAREPADGDS